MDQEIEAPPDELEAGDDEPEVDRLGDAMDTSQRYPSVCCVAK